MRSQQERPVRFYPGNREVDFKIRETVMAKKRGGKWQKTTIVEKLSDVTYNVLTGEICYEIGM